MILNSNSIELLMSQEPQPDRLDPKHLSEYDLADLEEALQADDLEVLVHCVDEIVGRHLRKRKQ